MLTKEDTYEKIFQMVKQISPIKAQEADLCMILFFFNQKC